MRRRWLVPALLVAVVAGVIILVVSGGWSEVTDAGRVKRVLTETGALGPAALIGLFASRLTSQTMAGCVLGGEVVFFLAMELALHWWRGRRVRVGEPA